MYVWLKPKGVTFRWMCLIWPTTHQLFSIRYVEKLTPVALWSTNSMCPSVYRAIYGRINCQLLHSISHRAPYFYDHSVTCWQVIPNNYTINCCNPAYKVYVYDVICQWLLFFSISCMVMKTLRRKQEKFPLTWLLQHQLTTAENNPWEPSVMWTGSPPSELVTYLNTFTFILPLNALVQIGCLSCVKIRANDRAALAQRDADIGRKLQTSATLTDHLTTLQLLH